MRGPSQKTENGLKLRIKLTPNSARDVILGVEEGSEDSSHLKIKIRAVPEKGKANKALCMFLAKSLGLPKSSFAVISGSTSRLKTVQITGDGVLIEKKLKDLLAGI